MLLLEQALKSDSIKVVRQALNEREDELELALHMNEKEKIKLLLSEMSEIRGHVFQLMSTRSRTKIKFSTTPSYMVIPGVS